MITLKVAGIRSRVPESFTLGSGCESGRGFGGGDGYGMGVDSMERGGGHATGHGTDEEIGFGDGFGFDGGYVFYVAPSSGWGCGCGGDGVEHRFKLRCKR